MKKIIPFLLAAVLPASALLAQTIAPAPVAAPPPEVEEDVVGSLDNDARIAIPASPPMPTCQPRPVRAALRRLVSRWPT